MSRPPFLREGGDFATLQVNPLKNEAAVRQHVQNAQPAWVLARRGCAFWTGLPIQRKFIRTRKSSLQTSKLQVPLRGNLFTASPSPLPRRRDVRLSPDGFECPGFGDHLIFR